MSARLMEKRIKGALLAFGMSVGMAAGLTGCVVVISDDGIEAGTEAHWDGSSRGDSELAVRVRDALKADALLQDSDFKVSVQDGVVTLRGTVKGTERFDRAVQLAKATQGVDKVVSKLKVEID
jgi:osmotically-inducible protein OsmY